MTIGRLLRIAVFIAVAGGAGSFTGRAPGLGPARALGEEPWRSEFDDVCSKTQDAMALSTEELRKLVERCDALRPKIEALDEARRKVFGRRLQACRDLYQFVLDYRGNAGS